MYLNSTLSVENTFNYVGAPGGSNITVELL